MHENFADWYRVVSIDPQKIPLDLRWRGVEAFVKDIDKLKALDAIRLFFDKQPKASDFHPTFKDVFKKFDKAFPMRDNDLEMQVLVGAAIAQMLKAGNSKVADAVGLAIICSDFQGLRQKPNLSEIVNLGYSYIHQRSDQMRRNINIPSVQLYKANLSEVTEKIKAMETSGTVAGVTAISSALVQLNGLPTKLASSVNAALTELTGQVLLLQEESNILWWLFGEYSRDLKKRIEEVGYQGASLVVGKELADLTLRLPGPVAAEAFLDKMLLAAAKNRKHKSIVIREAIMVSSLRDWKEKEIQTEKLDGLEDICTVHFALQQSVEAKSESEWVPTFEKRSGISAGQSLSAVILAMQVYRERLLIKAMQ